MVSFIYVNDLVMYDQVNRSLINSARLALDTETCIKREWIGCGGSALDPHTGRISTIQLCDGNTVYVYDLFWLEHYNYDPTGLIEVLKTSGYLLGHNIKFDLKHILSMFGVLLYNVRDTMIMSKLLANAVGSKFGRRVGHSLEDLCREYLGIHLTGKKTLRESDWGLPLESRTLDSQAWYSKLEYAAKDVTYLFQLEDILYPVLTLPLPPSADNPVKVKPPYGLGMSNVLELEFQCIPVTASMEYHGMPVNKKVFDVFSKALSNRINELSLFICRELDLETRYNPITCKSEPTPESLSILRSPLALPKFLAKLTKLSKITDTQSKTLERIIFIIESINNPNLVLVNEDEEELAQELRELESKEIIQSIPVLRAVVELKKLLKQESMKLSTYINPATGRIHTSFDQVGTATGRFASSFPNIQQVAARFSVNAVINTNILDDRTNEEIEYSISPRLGFSYTSHDRVLIDIDFSSQEALLAAAVSGDEKLISIFREPPTKVDSEGNSYDNPHADMHTLMTKNCCYPELFRDVDEKYWIKVAKTPLPNGVVPRQRGKILSYGSIYLQGAKTISEGNYVSLEEAKRWVEAFRKTYTTFSKWAAEKASIAETTGMSTNLNGRHRWCAESNSKGDEESSGRIGVNNQIQSLAADIGKLSLIRIHQALEGTGAFLVAIVHDEVIIDCPSQWSLDLQACERDKENPKRIKHLVYRVDQYSKSVAAKCKEIMEQAEQELINNVLPGKAGEPMIYPYWSH